MDICKNDSRKTYLNCNDTSYLNYGQPSNKTHVVTFSRKTTIH